MTGFSTSADFIVRLHERRHCRFVLKRISIYRFRHRATALQAITASCTVVAVLQYTHCLHKQPRAVRSRMSSALLVVMLLQGSAAAAPSKVRPVPTSYRALVASNAGESFRDVAKVAVVDTPTLEEDEVLIQVTYAGVNGGCETFRARGEHAFAGNKEQADFALGAEGVGIVAAVGGEVTSVAVGDAVCFVNAAFAEYTTSKAQMLWKIPEPTPEYVGLRISAFTSCAMLEKTGAIQKGEKVLITAAAGGAGHYAVQIAKANGCFVVGTTSSERKAHVLRELGCDAVVNYKEEDCAEAFKKICPYGFDVILEGVGGRMLAAALGALAPKGRLLQIGYISEYPHNPNAAEETAAHDLKTADLFWQKETVKRGVNDGQTIYGNAWLSDFSAVMPCKERVLGLYTTKGSSNHW